MKQRKLSDGQEILVANKIYIQIFDLKLANLRTMSSITMYKSLSSERYRYPQNDIFNQQLWRFRYHKNKLAETGGYDSLCWLNKKRLLQFHVIDIFPDATMTITDFKSMSVIKTGLAEKLKSDATR